MAETITYIARVTPHYRETVQTKKEGEIVVVLGVLSTTHRNAIELYLQKLSGSTLTSDATAFAAVVTAINALA